MNNKQRALFKNIFGEEFQEAKYKMVGHSFNRTVGGKQYCTRCGLIALNNDFSAWSIRMGCESDLHSSYKSQKKKAGGIPV